MTGRALLTPLTMRCARRVCLFILLVATQSGFAQSPTILPTRGTRFWTGFMQNGFGAQSLKLHIAAQHATSGTVSIPLTGWSTPFVVPADGVVVVDVPTNAENTGSGNVVPKGVLIQAADSVNVFASSFQNFTHDLSQVLPEVALGNKYRVDAYQGLPNFNNLHRSELLIVATQDGTQIRITPSVNTYSGQTAGVPFLVDLDKGETYQLQAATDVGDLTNTLVEATASSGPCRPFVVIGGSMCATVPGACQACDAVFEQLVPVSAWGTRYYTAPIHGVNTSTYRIMAEQNGTTVTINGGAPITLNAGQRYEVNGSTAPVCIHASLPVSVAQLLEGYSCAGNGDPSLFLVSPAERMSRSAAWNTSQSSLITQHSVSVVVPTASVGQLTLDGVVVPPSQFQSYPGCADRKHVKLTVSNGRHVLAAASGFQAYMFGTGYGESYAASVHDIKAEPVQQDSIVCGGGPLTLNVPEPLNGPVWVNDDAPNTVIATGSSYSFTPVASGSYTVRGQLPVSGCERTFTYHVGIPLTIPTLLTANDEPTITVCQYEPVQLALVPPPDPAWFTMQWTPGYSLSADTISAPVATPMSSTWYRVRVISPSGCGNMDDSILVNVIPANIQDLQISAQPSAVCSGGTVQLGSQAVRVLTSDAFNGGPSTTWTAIQGGAVNGACGSQSGTALYFDGNGQRYAQTIGLNTTGGGQVRFHLKIAGGTSPCDNADAGEDVVLEFTTNNGLSWSPVQTFDQDDFPGFTALAIDIPLSAQTTNTMFRLRQLANNGAGHDNWAIDDLLITRYDNNYLSYSWDQASTLNNAGIAQPIATPTTSGWYVLNGTDPIGGCVYQDSVYIQVDPAFTISITPNTTLCDGNGTTLLVTPSSGSNIIYSWTPNDGTLSAANIQSPFADPPTTRTYTVTATTGIGCTASGQVTVTVGQLQNLTVSASDAIICPGEPVQLNATTTGTGAITYAWTGPDLSSSTGANPIATPDQSATYVCTATQTGSGCTLTDSVEVVVNNGYTADLGPDITLCSTLGHQLSVQHNVTGATYQWSPSANLNASNIASPSILVDASATYSVTLTDPNGCSVSDQITITRAFSSVPAQVAVSSCANVPPVLNAPVPGVSYLWSTGATTPSITANSSGPRTVTVTDIQGCEVSTTFDVVLHPLPVVDLGADLSLCGEASQVLNAGNTGGSFLWTTGATTPQITVTSSGTYGVTVTNSNGCTASDNVQVALNNMPVDVLNDITACTSSVISLDAGNTGSTYSWNSGQISRTITPTSSGTYAVTVTTAAGCTSTFDAAVTIVPLVSVDLGADTTICAGSTITLTTGSTGLDHVWSTGATTSTISVNTAGTFSVTVSNSACTATDAIVVGIRSAPADVLQDATRCAGETVVLDAGNPGSSYSWNTGASTSTLSVSEGGTYSVLITDPSGCSGTYDATVGFVAPPLVQLGADTVLCEGETLLLDAGNAGAQYMWSTGANTRIVPVTVGGTYSVQVNNGICSRMDAVVVGFNPSPARMAARQFHTCLGEDQEYVRLDAGNPGSRYEWSTGERSQVILAGAYGWYVVEVTNQFDCAARDSAQIIEYCPSAIFIPNTFTPNADGTNDIFIPVGKNIAAMHLYIFDRWGNQLFESDNPAIGWDGSYGGEVVKNDIYVWRLTYKFFEDKDGTIGREQEQMGHIQVLR